MVQTERETTPPPKVEQLPGFFLTETKDDGID